jgi:hypothetical protein
LKTENSEKFLDYLGVLSIRVVFVIYSCHTRLFSPIFFNAKKVTGFLEIIGETNLERTSFEIRVFEKAGFESCLS